MYMINIEKNSNNKKEKIVIIFLIILLLVVGSLIIWKSTNKEVLDKEKEEIVVVDDDSNIDYGSLDDEVLNSVKCANSTCSLDCKNGMCECTYINENMEEEKIFCDME